MSLKSPGAKLISIASTWLLFYNFLSLQSWVYISDRVENLHALSFYLDSIKMEIIYTCFHFYNREAKFIFIYDMVLEIELAMVLFLLFSKILELYGY